MNAENSASRIVRLKAETENKPYKCTIYIGNWRDAAA